MPPLMISVHYPTSDGSMQAPAGTKSVCLKAGGQGGPGGNAGDAEDGPGGGGGGYAQRYFECSPGDIVSWTFGEGTYVHVNVCHEGVYKGVTAGRGGEGYIDGEGEPVFGMGGVAQGDEGHYQSHTYTGGNGSVGFDGAGGGGGGGAEYLNGNGANANGQGEPGQAGSGADIDHSAEEGLAGTQGEAGYGGGGGCRAGIPARRNGAAGGNGSIAILFWDGIWTG